MILKLALEQHRDPRSMHVQAWENCDKLSISFLLDLPHLHSSFTSPQLSETLGVLTGTELVKGSGKELWTVMGLLSTMQLFLGVTSAGGMTPSSRSTRWIETLVTEGIVPTKRKLPSFQPVLDSVFWAFCEASPGVWKLLDLMASKKLQTLGLKKGKSGGAAELSVITGQLKRRLSSAVMRANVIGLLDRRGKVGEGAGQANNRRQWIRAEEERLGWDQESQWLSRTTGRDLL